MQKMKRGFERKMDEYGVRRKNDERREKGKVMDRGERKTARKVEGEEERGTERERKSVRRMSVRGK